jgi:hypothetical protein
MTMLTPARRGGAIVASLATAALITLGGTGAVHASGSRDSDHDAMPDRWEVAHHLDAHRANAKGGPDRDGLSDLGEYRHRTRPHDADTDNDGVEDGRIVCG